MIIHALMQSYTALLSMQYNNTDSCYIHIHEKYRHQIISLLPVLSEKYTHVLFSLKFYFIYEIIL